jgi:hypothetical protein
MVARTKLSPIEYTVLGIAWKRGPCTTYALMKEMSSSTSTFFKNRASTIYPLVERLIKMGQLLTRLTSVACGRSIWVRRNRSREPNSWPVQWNSWKPMRLRVSGQSTSIKKWATRSALWRPKGFCTRLALERSGLQRLANNFSALRLASRRSSNVILFVS